jgi:hypothetical protein
MYTRLKFMPLQGAPYIRVYDISRLRFNLCELLEYHNNLDICGGKYGCGSCDIMTTVP